MDLEHHHHDEECDDPSCTCHEHHHEHEHAHEHEHHHHHGEECSDPNCSCHEHEHHHHHHGEECSDPNCSCHEHHHEHESEAERAVSSSFVISRTRSFSGSFSPSELRQRAEQLFLILGSRADLDGIIPGHIKGVISAPGGEKLGISVTRPDAVDFVPAGGWETLETLDTFTMTVNIMLLSDVGITEADLFRGIS